MDSNFQVKITADVSALQASMKSVEAQLSKFNATTNSAGSSMDQASSSANRMSLAAFALGQVIRDSGFFAQNFALGILAISNNIPILVDQLTKLLALSAGVATAISLVASVLTAGLTIWAYSAMSAKKAGEEYEKAMEKANASSQAQIATFNSLMAIARDSNRSFGERKQAVDKLNESFDGLNNNLTVANANEKQSISLAARVVESLKLQAEATALATLAGEAYVENIKARNSALQDNAGFENQAYAQILRNLGFFTEAEKLLIETGAKNRDKAIKDSQKAYDDYAKKLQDVNSRLAKLGMLNVDGGKGAKDTIFDTLKESLTAISLDPTLNQIDIVKAKIDAYQSALKSLIDEGYKPNSKAVKDVTASLAELSLMYDSLTVKSNVLKEAQLKQPTTGLAGLGREISNEELAATLKRFEDINKQANFMKQFNEDTKEANESVTALVRTVGNDLVNSFMVMMETGRFSFESIGQALLGMIKRLVAAAAAAAVLSVILSKIFPNATNTSFKDIFRGISGINIGGGLSAASSPTVGAIATNGINTSINSSNAMSAGGGVLETRVSGNDLVILLDRASNNRNKYF